MMMNEEVQRLPDRSEAKSKVTLKKVQRQANDGTFAYYELGSISFELVRAFTIIGSSYYDVTSIQFHFKRWMSSDELEKSSE